MNKDIQRTQDKLLEAKNERARAEVRYNSHIIMAAKTGKNLTDYLYDLFEEHVRVGKK